MDDPKEIIRKLVKDHPLREEELKRGTVLTDKERETIDSVKELHRIFAKDAPEVFAVMPQVHTDLALSEIVRGLDRLSLFHTHNQLDKLHEQISEPGRECDLAMNAAILLGCAVLVEGLSPVAKVAFIQTVRAMAETILTQIVTKETPDGTEKA